MPVNKNALTRFQVLDELLSNRYHHYTLDEIVDKINERLVDLGISEVGRRCVEKDIAYLRGEYSPFFADIESYSVDVVSGGRVVKKRCLRYKRPEFSIFKKEMSDDEAYLLSQTLSLLGVFDGLPQLGELSRLQKEISKGDDRRIVSFTKNPLDKSDLFGRLFSAISQKQVVKLSYHTFADPISKPPLLLHPYLLKEYNRRWYLFGAADIDSKILSFSLDQIDIVEPMPAQRFRESEGNLDELFEDIIGVSYYANRPIEHILFWVSERQKAYVATKPLHDSQILYKGASDDLYRTQYAHFDRGAFFSIKCIENYELIRELCSYGADLVVLTPLHIREQVCERIQAMSSAYRTLSECEGQ